MEANLAPSDNENGRNTQQATEVQNAQAADNTNGQSPVPTPGAAQAQATRQTRMQTDVVHPPCRSYVQTPPMHARGLTGPRGGIRLNRPCEDKNCCNSCIIHDCTRLERLTPPVVVRLL